MFDLLKNKINFITQNHLKFIVNIVFSIITVSAIGQIKRSLLEKKEFTEKYHDTIISDPYRYVENLKDSTVINWIKNNNNITNSYFERIESTEKIINKILGTYEKEETQNSSAIITDNDNYFYLKTNTKENFSKLYHKKGKDGNENLIFDPSLYKSGNNIKYSINHVSPCRDGKKVALGVAENDNEFSDIIVIDVVSKQIIFETNKKSWPSALGGVKWNANCDGIFYTYVPVTDKNKKGYLFNTKAIYFDIGNDQQEIEMFSKTNNPNIPFREEDFPLLYFNYHKNKHIVGTVAGVSRYRDAYISLLDNKNKDGWMPLFKVSDKIKSFYLLEKELIFLSAKDASNFKICKASIKNSQIDHSEILVPESKDEIITNFAITKDGIYFVRVRNGVDAKLMFLNKDKTISQISLPTKAGSISLKTKSPDYSDLWVTVQGWSSSSVKYYYDIKRNSFELVNSTSSSKKDRDEVVIEEVLVSSHDGEEIPLSIIYKKEFQKDGNCPLFITAYGAYGRNIKPRSTTLISNWIDEGGVYAVAHVRGGGEKGYGWHTGGLKLNKANSWKDLISCVQYLQNNKYSQPSKTVGWGASAGGITVGRAILEEPNLFTAGVITSGILNTLRSEFAPNGKNNVKEFGTVEDEEQFTSLLDMDCYHSLKKDTNYPAFLITTGYNDNRVASWQSTKFAARLQEYTTSGKPILYSVDFEAGHGRENTRKKTLTKISKRIAFALWQTGHPDYQPKD